MTRSLIEKYRTGMITDDHLVVEALRLLDPEDPGAVLSSLPDEILSRIERFATECLRGQMITNYGPLPEKSQVLAARHWIEKTLQQKAGQTV
jgi:hypothetical protein